MAESALIPAAMVTLKLLLSPANDQIADQMKLACCFKQDHQKLRRRLEIIQAFLNDAEDRKITLRAMMVWLQHLTAATSDAENVFDELAYENLRRNCKRNKVCYLFTFSHPLLFRFKMANKVSSINKLLDQICKEAADIGLKPAEQIERPTVERLEPFRPTHPFTDDTQVVGRDGDVKKVVEMLLCSQGDLPVTAIVGMAGLGKTTLAQLVYKEPEVLKNFGEERVWICVSDNFNVLRLLNEMVQSLPGEKHDTPNVQGAVGELGKKLKGKKYLLILDDVWTTDRNLWDSFRNPLLAIEGSKESKVLVTTRSKDVVSAMRCSCTLDLMTLSGDDSWTMFRKRAFDNGGPRETTTLMQIGRRLVAKCKGVPLSISLLGGILRSEHDEQKWESIEKISEIWNLEDNENGIQEVLKLSFDHLPDPSLKQCFAYCSIFLKDKVIEKDELIQLWMAQGFLQSSSRSNVEMEELGEQYFNTLWHNSLFQEVKFNEYYKITTCKMHDLVHDLAVLVSKGNWKDGETKNIGNVQHLSLVLEEEKGFDISKEDCSKLRTLFVRGHLPGTKILYERVRALRLVDSIVKELPNSICKSIHLRFLDLSESRILKIPNCITKLYNLETLKLPGCVEEFPKDFHNLVSLRHLYLMDSSRKLMPMNIGRLTSLRTLPFFVVGNESGQRIEELGSLSKLGGGLHIHDLQNVKDKEEAEKAKMLEKTNIQFLQYDWGLESLEPDKTDVLEGLKPHRNVKGLEIFGFAGRRLASWMREDVGFLQNLVMIELNACRFCEQVPVLGQLPRLEIVKMRGFKSLTCIGPEFFGLSDGNIGNCSSSGSGGLATTKVFPALRELTLVRMDELKEWSEASSLDGVAASAMEFFPCLQQLMISDCPKLTSLPTAMEFFPRLQQLKIDRCPKLTSLPGLGRRLASWMDKDAGSLQNLVKIELIGLDLWEQVPVLGGLPHLEIVYLRGLKSLTCIGPEFYGLGDGKIGNCSSSGSGGIATTKVFPALRELTLFGMDELKEWWDASSLDGVAASAMDFFPRLEKLAISGCPKLTSLPAFKGSTSLQRLFIYGCDELTCLPEGILQPILEYLFLYNCPKLKAPNPYALRSLTSLRMLGIMGCPNWGSCWAEGLGCTTSLFDLSIGGFGEEYRYFPWPSSTNAASQLEDGHFTSLEILELKGWPEVKSLPEQLEHLSALRSMEIKDFSGLEFLPECLGQLSSLRRLEIIDCPILRGTYEELKGKIGTAKLVISQSTGCCS